MTDYNNTWRKPQHKTQRREVLIKIVKHFIRRLQNPTKERRDALLRISKKLEARLYFTSPSLEYYLDDSTLMVRIKHIGTEILLSRGGGIIKLEIPEIFIEPDIECDSSSSNDINFSDLPRSTSLPPFPPVASDNVVASARMHAGNIAYVRERLNMPPDRS